MPCRASAVRRGRSASMLERSKVLSEMWASQILTSRFRPARDFPALRRLHFVVEVGSELLDVARQNGKVDDADRCEFVLALDRSQRVLEADDAFFQAAAQRAHGLAIVRQVGQHFGKDAGRVADAVEVALHMRRRRFRPVAAGGRDRRSGGRRGCRCRPPRRSAVQASPACRCDTS